MNRGSVDARHLDGVGTLAHGLAAMWQLLTRKERVELAWLVALMTVGSLLAMGIAASVLPYFAVLNGSAPGWLQDAVRRFGVDPIPALTACIALLVLSYLVVAILTRWRTVGFEHRLQRNLVLRLIDGYMNAEWNLIAQRNGAELMKYMTITAVDAAWACERLLSLISAGIVMALLIGLAFAMDPLTSTWLLLAGGLLGLTVQAVLGPMQRRAARRREVALRRLHSGLSEALRAGREVRSLGAATWFQEEIARAADDIRRGGQVLNTLPTFPRLVIENAALLALIGVVTYWTVAGRSLETIVPQMVFFGVLARWLLPAVATVLNVRTHLHGLHLNIVLVHEQMKANEEARSMRSDRAVPGPGQRLVLQSVTCGYDPDAPVLKGVDLVIEAGTWTALTGASGAGKSTLFDVLAGLRLPDSGEIRIEGATGVDSVGGLSCVPQTPALLDASVIDNVCFGADQDDRARIHEELACVALSDWLAALPDGLDTRLGDADARVSGGERQRLAIARALHRQPSLLLLDEATAALDTATEMRVLRALRERYPAMTVIFATHHAAPLALADQVVHLAGGRCTQAIAEQAGNR